ncbi:PaaI family thioesterase [Niveispirillum sp.]|uniref:PaaI family thioesterase n=1 Tax=Niveispirillum sp. TaxID=1917217 RepID=UPI001B454DC5|nr:PaaI family thioesterase [Niveispirillum sp.]MBP7338563.1 PaaI family thioesterase [Niveispirillum sp.]
MHDQEKSPALGVADFIRLLDDHMPQVRAGGFTVLEMGWGRCVMQVKATELTSRAGGTIAGPTMFALADLALYGAVLSQIGEVPLAVTSDMNIHFLRKPPLRPLRAEARILKPGKRLAYGEILIRSIDDPVPVAHATGTYAIPSG